MEITVNGEQLSDLPDDMTVRALLAHLGLPEKKIAVECNREIISKSRFGETVLMSGDQLEVIHFIGGG